MPHPRITVASLMIAVLVMAAGLFGLRVGSMACCRWVYALTALALLVATVAARWHGPFWLGFAVFGWGYFLWGFGPLFVQHGGFGCPEGLAGNPNLPTTAAVERLADWTVPDPPEVTGRANLERVAEESVEWHEANIGLCHCFLTLALAGVGGLVACLLAPRHARPRLDAEQPVRADASVR
jgi:hypothetical protein